MTRIASLPVDQWDKELRELAQGDTLPPVQQTMLGVYANAPELAKPFLIFTGAMSQGLYVAAPLAGVGPPADCLSQSMPQLHGRSL